MRPARSSQPQERIGVAATECALVLPVVLFVVFSLTDLGLATMRYNVLADAARRVARSAILNGSLAPSGESPWGPEQIDCMVPDDDTISALLAGKLPTMSPQRVSIQIAWEDGSNDPGDRVRVDLRYDHQTLIPFMATWGPIEIHAATSMRIVN